jgi:ATP-dependent DNA helicase RecG
MKKSKLKAIAVKGEDSRLQFKQDIRNVDALATEMVAFSNILPYRGLGSGIKRALDAWPEIDFVDDRDGCLFTATVHRKAAKSSEIVSVKADGSLKSSEKILSLLRTEPDLSAREIARKIGITPRAVEKQIAKLRKAGRLQRIGPA